MAKAGTLLCLALAAFAAGARLDDAPAALKNAVMASEMAALKAAQDTVKQAQLDLDGIDQNGADKAAMGASAMVQDAKKEQEHPDLGEALMKEDDANPMPGLDNDAAVQVQATANAVQEENQAEGEEKADPADLKSVMDMSKSMKKSDLLPEGWEEKFDAESGKSYYENMATKTTTWDPPRSLVNIALTAAQGQMHLQREVAKLKRRLKMKLEQGDLGESADVSDANSEAAKKCPKMLSRVLGEAKQLHSHIKSLASKLNLTGEQQKLLQKLLKTEAMPVIPETLLKLAKQEEATKKTAKKAAAKVAKTAKKVEEHSDLGESNDVLGAKKDMPDMPAELGESAALEAQDENMEEAKVTAAMKAESAKVARQFAKDQSDRAELIRKASVQAGQDIETKMAKEDQALMDDDKETDSRMQDIIGDQHSLETEQALFRGTLTPDQVNQVVDPDVAKMEKDDLTTGDDFNEYSAPEKGRK